MEYKLEDILPNSSSSWIISKEQILYKKYISLPICRKVDNYFIVFLDRRIYKAVLKLVSKLMKIGVEFYCLSPEASSPKGLVNYHSSYVTHYLRMYATNEFYYGFEKIGFDLIKNMTDWVEKENCFEVIRPCYDEVLSDVLTHYYDYYSKKDIWNYPKEIRDSYESLYRDIQINRII
jgi:hypothetical protein